MFFKFKSSKLGYASIDDEKLIFGQSAHSYFMNIVQFWKEAVIICLCIVCAILISEKSFKAPDVQDRIKVESYRLVSEDTRWRQFQWNTNIYSTSDEKAAEAINAAWDQIVPAHGIVAVDHQWATEHNLPDSMGLPSDPSKGVYIIDAYHQLHCLAIIRKTLIEIASGQASSKPVEHSWHCFDSLLQYILCGTSGDTLLYTWGRNETGDGQLRKCIDWDSRKNWAKDNTACYKDGDHPIPLYDHFDHCENKDDGVRVHGF